MTRLSAGDPMPVGNHRLSSIQTCASVHPQLAGSAPKSCGSSPKGGDDDQDLANIFGLTLAQVRCALACEATQAA
jgi:hypothetical protein